jgi:LemA protein
MSRGQWVLGVVVAALVLWMVGAYNRLISLRNVIKQSWSKVDDAVQQRATAIEPLLGALRGPLAAEQGALDRLRATHLETTQAAAAMTALPVVEAHASRWVSTEAAVAAAASRVFALVEHSIEVQETPEVQALATVWRDAESRLVFARQLYNEAALEYNEAIALFPTRLLVPIFRFGPAGRL